MRILSQDKLTELPVLRIKDSLMGDRVIGSNVHDIYILGKDGGLHYLNTQGMIGTGYGELEFEVEEYECYKVFESWNFIELMDHDAKRLGISESEDYKKTKEKIKDIFTKAFNEKEERKNKKLMEVLQKDFIEG
ncbi:hypothetical protein ACQRC6_01180 [Peptoniphilus sp. SGI.035]|uniref:hypothetical protein n=1 Tax=Peptoniphilus sp. SGI.035 TaxID=3420564 RepID=UPI003D0811CD